jgi:outer membrane protein
MTSRTITLAALSLSALTGLAEAADVTCRTYGDRTRCDDGTTFHDRGYGRIVDDESNVWRRRPNGHVVNPDGIGAIPLARWQFQGERAVTLVANDLRVNVLDAGGWRLGPEGILRFGRSDVKDDVVNRVHEVDLAIDLGAFVGYDWHVAGEPRMRLSISAWTLWDVTDSHGGWTVGANVYGAYPVARPVTLTAGSGVTYGSESYMRTYFGVTPEDSAASGLRAYTPDAGLRDVRGWLVMLVHLSPKWTIGGGGHVLLDRRRGGREPDRRGPGLPAPVRLRSRRHVPLVAGGPSTRAASRDLQA